MNRRLGCLLERYNKKLLASFFYYFILHLAAADSDCECSDLRIELGSNPLEFKLWYYRPTERDWHGEKKYPEIFHTLGRQETYEVKNQFYLYNSNDCGIEHKLLTSSGIDVATEFPGVELRNSDKTGGNGDRRGKVEIVFSYWEKVDWQPEKMQGQHSWKLECYSANDNAIKASVVIPVTFTWVCDEKTTAYDQQ